MQVHITGRHVEITDAIRDHIYDKIERTLAGFTRVENVSVILDLQKLVHYAEVIVKGKDLDVEGHASEENMYTSIDLALVKTERQLRKLREKIQEHR